MGGLLGGLVCGSLDVLLSWSLGSSIVSLVRVGLWVIRCVGSLVGHLVVLLLVGCRWVSRFVGWSVSS